MSLKVLLIWKPQGPLWDRGYSENRYPTIFFCPIGSVYTMDAKQAVRAIELVQPGIVIPMHFGTFPVLDDETKFLDLVGDRYRVEVFKHRRLSENYVRNEKEIKLN